MIYSELQNCCATATLFGTSCSSLNDFINADVLMDFYFP